MRSKITNYFPKIPNIFRFLVDFFLGLPLTYHVQRISGAQHQLPVQCIMQFITQKIDSQILMMSLELSFHRSEIFFLTSLLWPLHWPPRSPHDARHSYETHERLSCPYELQFRLSCHTRHLPPHPLASIWERFSCILEGHKDQSCMLSQFY